MHRHLALLLGLAAAFTCSAPTHANAGVHMSLRSPGARVIVPQTPSAGDVDRITQMLMPRLVPGPVEAATRPQLVGVEPGRGFTGGSNPRHAPEFPAAFVFVSHSAMYLALGPARSAGPKGG